MRVRNFDGWKTSECPDARRSCQIPSIREHLTVHHVFSWIPTGSSWQLVSSWCSVGVQLNFWHFLFGWEMATKVQFNTSSVQFSSVGHQLNTKWTKWIISVHLVFNWKFNRMPSGHQLNTKWMSLEHQLIKMKLYIHIYFYNFWTIFVNFFGFSAIC